MPHELIRRILSRHLLGAASRQLRGHHRDGILKDISAHAVCAEIGVWKGEFSEKILATARPRELHLVDPWLFDPRYPSRWYGGSAAKSQADMDEIYEDVVRKFKDYPHVLIHRMASESFAASLDDEYFDWVYIDANHSYEEVKKDLELWHKRVKPGGMIVGDDYSWRDENGDYPVKRAFHEFTSSQKLRNAYVRNGQFVI